MSEQPDEEEKIASVIASVIAARREIDPALVTKMGFTTIAFDRHLHRAPPGRADKDQ